MALVEKYYAKDLRIMEEKLQSDPQFITDYNNTYRYLLQKAKRLEKKLLIREKSKQSERIDRELKAMKNYDHKSTHLEMNLRKSHNFGQPGDVKRYLSKLFKRKEPKYLE